MANTIEPGVIHHRALEGTVRIDYLIYLPQSGIRENRIFISIHGISRNAEEHVKGFIAQAEKTGTVIVAPLFPKNEFPRYQRLGATLHEGRADFAFDRILQEVQTMLNIDPAPLKIFGFSGGGQFAHRYAMFYPKRVSRLVLGAPGWYTFPNPDRTYPYGLRSSIDWPRLRFTPRHFLAIPTLVMVGENDNIRDEDLNKMRRIDAAQGLDRIERGEKWVLAMNAMARAYQTNTSFRFESVPNASHAYESYLAHPPFAETVFNFMFEN
jgi:pimeloyl-ACP methyl ester carboxylesterase